MKNQQILILIIVLLGFQLSYSILPQNENKKNVQDTEDIVYQWPQWPPNSTYNFSTYSGYAYATQNGSRQIHYVLLTSQDNSTKDPLIIWLNGGPGCSSMIGFVQEIGPFLFVNDSSNFSDNLNYSWNRNASVLYFESPPGVGFSINNDINTGYVFSDEDTAQDNLNALISFYNKHPQYQNNSLWIAGESYAGMYIPFFVDAITTYNEQTNSTKIPIKGFMIGNGVFYMDYDILDFFTYNAYDKHLFYGPILSKIWEEDCAFNMKGPRCQYFFQQANILENNTDPYDMYAYTYNSSDNTPPKQVLNQKQSKELTDKEVEDEENNKRKRVLDRLRKWTEKKKSKSNLSQQQNWQTPDEIITNYFNNQTVQQQININPTISNWSICANIDYNAAPNSTYLYPKFFAKKYQMLIYSGNTDAVVPFPYTELSLNMLMDDKEVKGQISQEWRQQGLLQPNQQMPGFVQVYTSQVTKSSLSLAVIRAAGHEVPMYQPQAAFQMMYNFTNNIPL